MEINAEPFLPEISTETARTQLVTANDSEIIIAFVGAVGVNLNTAEEAAKEKLEEIGYRVVRIRVTKDVFPVWTDPHLKLFKAISCEFGR